MDQSINNGIRDNLVQQEESSSSNTKRKLYLFLYLLLIIFTLIIVALTLFFIMLKHDADSKSLSANPDEAIRAVCRLPNLSQNPHSCFNSMATLYYTRNLSASWTPKDKINPSQILILSLYASINDLINLSTAPEKMMSQPESLDTRTVEALKECKEIFNYSISQLTGSLEILGVDPDEEILKTKRVQLQVLVGEAMTQVVKCTFFLEKSQSRAVKEIRARNYMALQKVMNSRGIVENVDKIMQEFYPGILSTLGTLIFYIWTDNSFLFFVGCIQLVMFYQLVARVFFSF
ncbi:hypothetical protein A4A49_22354 [Nicotiana attenuata]|uniref:Pectinesterase inhibitor domain-containing protein n=1 Tax=Nicotiana attenuata TaxID=49451 RepID=A0A314KXQ2_NICAT|nr:hypothetical protein A4A49_22354 [Nicotiana attenuata]